MFLTILTHRLFRPAVERWRQVVSPLELFSLLSVELRRNVSRLLSQKAHPLLFFFYLSFCLKKNAFQRSQPESAQTDRNPCVSAMTSASSRYHIVIMKSCVSLQFLQEIVWRREGKVVARENCLLLFCLQRAVISSNLFACSRVQLWLYRKSIRRASANNLTTTRIAFIVLNINAKYFVNILTVIKSRFSQF